jgi:histidinol-phosphate aminotransferase
MAPYSSARDDFDQSVVDESDFVYLDANENPNDTGRNRYPDPHQRAIKKKLSVIKGIPSDQIFLGNGSDEAIDLVIRLFCDGINDNILIPGPTYGMYKVSAEINNVTIRTTLLDENFALPANLLSSTDSNTKIIFLCSPNNPSGNLLDGAMIKSILETFRGIVVVDEAYIDFTDQKGWLGAISAYPNLIVLQTFSKAWGLAALRLGMAFASKEIISLINKIKPPYNISSVTQQLALDSLERISEMRAWVGEIKSERSRLATELSKLSTVKKVYRSDANFLLVQIERAAEVYRELIAKKIVVRDRSTVKRCEDCLRLTVGTREENDRLLNALK